MGLNLRSLILTLILICFLAAGAFAAAPTIVGVDGNSTSWRTADFNVTFIDVDFTAGGGFVSAQYSTNGGASYTDLYNSTLDSNYIAMITSDGNYTIDARFIATDLSVLDVNSVYAKLDKTAPVVAAAVTTGMYPDEFYGLDQNVRISITLGADANTSGTATLDVNFYDVNGTSTWVRADNNSSTVFDFNLGRGWTHNFTSTTLEIRVIDGAGNITIQDLNNPIILYDMNIPTGAGLVTGSTNFQNVTNFADINTLVFKTSLGQIAYYDQDINLSTYEQAVKLMALSSALSMDQNATTGNIRIDLNSLAFSDINKSAKVTIYNLPFATIPGILVDDANCGTSMCLDVNYDYAADTNLGRLDFNVLHFSKYESDGNAPIITDASSTSSSRVYLRVNTNEATYCKYSESTNVSYASNSAAATTIGISHEWVVPVVFSSTAYTYYVQCRDSVGNDTNATIIATTLSGGTGTGSSSGGTTPTGTTTSTTTTESTTTDTYSPTSSEVASMLEGSGLTAAEITEYSNDAASGSVTIERTLVVEKIVTGIVTSYKSTFSISVKNTSGKNMKDVKVVETVPKSVALNASQITSAYEFRVVNADPVIEFIVPNVSAGQSATVTYSVNKQVALSDFSGMGAPVAKFTEITAPVTPPTTPPVTPPATPPATTGTDTGADTEATPAPMDYTMLIVLVVVVVIAGAIYLVVKKKK